MALSRCWFAFFVLVLAACNPTDLPSGWEDAEPLAIVQGPCSGSAYDNIPEAVQINARAGGLDVVYDNAHFRCEQELVGFVRRSSARAEVLIQPEDMDPSTVAKCDCLYRITAAIEAGSGEHEVAVYRRGDKRSGRDQPVLAGAAQGVVP